MKTILKNATLLPAYGFGDRQVHVTVKNRKIAAVSAELPPNVHADEVIDCGGDLLMPAFCNAHCHRGESHYGAHRCTYRQGYEAGCKKDAWQQQAVGQQVHGKIYGGLDGTHTFCSLCKGTGEDEYPYHQHHILMGGASRKDVDATFYALATSDGDGIDGRYQKCHSDRHLVKIIDDDRGDQIKAQEHKERTECHKTAPLGGGRG